MLNSRPVPLHNNASHRATKTPGRTARKARAMRENCLVEPQRLFKDSKYTTRTASRPLGDKTPLPNRVAHTVFTTPFPNGSKLSKLALLDPDGGETPGAPLRPSSTRTHIRVPRSGSKSPETPPNISWVISDGDVSAGPPESQTVEEAERTAEDYDEIEYMPPAVDDPYKPSFDFDIPDYKTAGKTLLNLTRSYLIDNSSSYHPDYDDSNLDLLINWDMDILVPPTDVPGARMMAGPLAGPDRSGARTGIASSSRPTTTPSNRSKTGVSGARINHTRSVSVASARTTTTVQSTRIGNSRTTGAASVTAAALPSSQTAARGGLKPTTATTTSRIPIPSFGGLNKVGTNGTGTTTRGRNVTTGPKKEDDLILVTKEYDALENDFRFDV